MTDYVKTWDRPPLGADGERMKYWFPHDPHHHSLPLMYRHDKPSNLTGDNAHREFWRDREGWIDRASEAETALRAQTELIENAQRILTKLLVPDDPEITTDKDAINALLTLLDGPEQRAINQLVKDSLS